ncbi:MAG TPA: acylphosphatase, partial [Anaerolineae bacterium]
MGRLAAPGGKARIRPAGLSNTTRKSGSVGRSEDGRGGEPAVLETAERLRVEIQGAVQGVGFRPFVYRLATDLALAGWVINDTRGV